MVILVVAAEIGHFTKYSVHINLFYNLQKLVRRNEKPLTDMSPKYFGGIIFFGEMLTTVSCNAHSMHFPNEEHNIMLQLCLLCVIFFFLNAILIESKSHRKCVCFLTSHKMLITSNSVDGNVAHKSNVYNSHVLYS